jgi:hypothetical protein
MRESSPEKFVPWTQTKDNRIPNTIREFRGVNKLDAFSIGDIFSADMKNLTSSKYPALTVRPGYAQIGATIGNKVLGIGVWKDAELHAVFNDGTWRKWDGSAWTTIKSGLSTTAEVYFTNFQGAYTGINLIMANGVDAVQRYDGATVQNVLNAPSNAKYITTFQNRLWVSMNGDKEIRASALDNAEEWTPGVLNDSLPFGKEIESPVGETINGLFGELAKLTISFPNSIRKLLGGVPSDFNDQSVSQTLGIVNNRSAVTLDGTMYLFNANGFYSYSGGVSPDKSVSQVVQYYADNSNTAARNQSAVGSDGKNLYFAIPISSSTAPDTIIEYDKTVRAWNVWKDIQALHFVRMGNDCYIGDALGRVLKMGGTTDNGTAISSELISKWFTAPSMSQVIRWMRMWLTVDLPSGSSLTVYLNKSEDEPWEEVGSITASSDIQRKPIYVASSKVTNAKQLRYRIVGSGPYTLHEIAWDADYQPMR